MFLGAVLIGSFLGYVAAAFGFALQLPVTMILMLASTVGTMSSLLLLAAEELRA